MDDEEQGQVKSHPVAVVDWLAQVLRAWEEDHAGWRVPQINGSELDPATGERYAREKQECACEHCQDARAVLREYDESRAGGPSRPL